MSFRTGQKNHHHHHYTSHPLQLFSSGSHSFFNHFSVLAPFLQDKLTSIKYVFFFFFKAGAKGRSPRCFLGLLFPCTVLLSQEQLRGERAHVTVFSTEVGDYFWKHSQARRCKRGVCRYSIFILYVPNVNFLFPSDATFAYEHLVLSPFRI